MASPSLTVFNNAIEDIIKDTIRKKGLVDSGKLLNTIKVTSKFVNQTLDIDVTAQDYFQYLDKRYNIMRDAMATKKWDDAVEAVTEAFINEYIENEIKTILE